MCQGPVSCSRCSLQSFFVACFQPRSSGCFHPMQMSESSDLEFRCCCRRMVDPGSVRVQVPTELERNLEPAPSHFAPQQQLLPKLQKISDQALFNSILVNVSFHNSKGVSPEPTPRHDASPGRISRTSCMSLNLFLHFLVAPSSFRICPQCVHPSEDGYPSSLQLLQHATAMFPTC